MTAVKVKKITKTSEAKRLKKELAEADKKFAKEIKERDGYRCAVCRSTENLHTHHILPRERKDIRHELMNGITLCCLHHKFSLDISPHKNAFEFFAWLAKARPIQFAYCMNMTRAQKVEDEMHEIKWDRLKD